MIDPERICMRCMTRLTEGSSVCAACGEDNEQLQNDSHQLPVRTILAGKYLVGYALGQGGFGITYVGWDINLELKVAIKEYYPEGCVSRELTMQSTVIPLRGTSGEYFLYGREKFVQEAKALAKFTGTPGVVNVRDFFTENGTAYIVMDFVDGRTMKQLAEANGGRLPAQTVLQMIYPVILALQKVHAAGLLHRDISPDNIMVRTDGSAVLLDFGAARQISASGEHSNTVNVKHGFAPEEQYREHGEQGPWTDVYALSATIYRMVTGVTPTQALDRLVSGDTLPLPNTLGAGMTDAQQAAVMHGLAIYARDRFQSVTDFIAALYGGTTVYPPQPALGNQTVWGAQQASAPEGGRVQQKINKSNAAPATGIAALPKGGLIGIIAGGAALLILILVLALGGGKEAEPAVVEANADIEKTTAVPNTPEPEITAEPVLNGIVTADGACQILEPMIHMTYTQGSDNRTINFILPVKNMSQQNMMYPNYDGDMNIYTENNTKLDSGYLKEMVPSIIAPGETGYLIGWAWFEAKGLDSVVVKPDFDLYYTTSDAEQFDVSNVKLTELYGYLLLSCNLENNTTVDYGKYDIRVCALFRNKSGELLGYIENSIGDEVACGQSADVVGMRSDDPYFELMNVDDAVSMATVYAAGNPTSYAKKGDAVGIGAAGAYTVDGVTEESIEATAARQDQPSTPKVAEKATPTPTAQPETDNVVPVRTTITINGRDTEAYAADLSNVSYEKVGYWSDSPRQISNSRSYTYCLRGRIQDCYGVTMYYSTDVESGNPFSVPWKALVRLISGDWSRGDAEAEKSYSYKGGEAHLSVLFLKPQSFSEFIVVPVSMTNDQWETTATTGIETLYFATEEACQAYIDSVL